MKIGRVGAGSIFFLSVLMHKPDRATPQVEVRDAAGKLVYSGKIEHGGGRTRSHTWRVPGNLKGKFTVTPKYDAGPFEVKLKETSITIK